MPQTLDVDYVVVGAGAMGMAFTDTLITETGASLAVSAEWGPSCAFSARARLLDVLWHLLHEVLAAETRLSLMDSARPAR